MSLPGSADIVIVGGGSAGCVLAGRLSEDPHVRVLLVEAGRDLPPGEEPAAILDMYPGRAAFDPGNHWPGLKAHLQPVGHNDPDRPPLVAYEQARIMGGGSSVNGQVANRGTPEDYDEWAALGATGWGWDDVLPYFKKLERDLDFSGPLHGRDGPIPIHRIPDRLWPGFSLALREALAAAGFPDLADQNAAFEDGQFPMSLSNDGRHRVSTAMAYLGHAVRARPNLVVLANSDVRGLTFEGQHCTGVTIERRGEPARTIAAREVILCAGAIHSPAMLLRAGIGPAAALHALGIEVRADLPGVGRNLQEHPGTSTSLFLRAPGRLRGTTRRHVHLGLRYSSGVAGCPRSDMYLMAAARSGWHPLGRRIGTLIAWINKPFARGHVALATSSPTAPPVVAFNHLADPRDASRLVDALRFMAELAARPELAGHIDHAVASSYTGFAKRLGRPNRRNWLLGAAAAAALDLLPPLRGPFMRGLVGGGRGLGELLADDDAAEAHVRARVFGQWHACGTCRLGEAGDPDAVTEPASARVHGIGGLRVVDASLMPTVPRANLNIPTIMLAEKLASAIRRESSGRVGPGAAQPAVQPPSTMRAVPVTSAEASLAR